jgi:ABC-type glutathione transport system ATPase component
MNLSEQVSETLQSVKQIGKSNKRKRVYTQYLNQDNRKRPSQHLELPPRQEFLEAGVYKLKSDFSGIFYEVHEINTDELLRFKDERYEEVLNEINDFWTKERKDKFKNMGFTHKRGIILFGEAGVGKSCLMKLVMEQMIEQGDIVFLADSDSIYRLKEGIRQFKEIEPDRNCIVILEDIDEAMKYGEKAFLNLFDGDDQIDGVLYLAT